MARLRPRIILLSLLLIGCGRPFEPVSNIHPDIKPFYNMFLADMLFYKGYESNRIITMKFKGGLLNKEGKPAIGNCNKTTITYIDIDTKKKSYVRYTISIDPKFWYPGADVDKFVLSYHEMGHCLLDIEHRIAYSIMEKDHIGERYLDDPEYYLRELFGVL